jgi:hypothetical protein
MPPKIPFDLILSNAGSVAASLKKRKTVVKTPWSDGFGGPLSLRGASTYEQIRHNKAITRAAAGEKTTQRRQQPTRATSKP